MSQADHALTTTIDGPTTSRRSFLSVAGAMAAGLCLPATAVQALAVEGSTPISRLWSEHIACLPEIERLTTESEEACGRFFKSAPAVPDDMCMSEFDGQVTGLKRWLRFSGYNGRAVTWVEAAGWRHSVERPLGRAEIGLHASISAAAQHRARAVKVLPIAEKYEAAVDAAKIASGLTAADLACEVAWKHKHSLERAILNSAPETFGDLVIQAKLIEQEWGGPDSEEANFDGAGRSLLRSIKVLAAQA